MKNKLCKCVLITAMLFFVVSLYGQRSGRNIPGAVVVCGEYIYEAPANVSLDQARRIAIEGAKTKALQDNFGTTMTLSVASSMRSSNNSEAEWFSMTNVSEANGEWLEDIGTPTFDVNLDRNGNILVKVSNVCGNARELLGTRVDVSAKILKKVPDVNFESNDFNDGDELYLAFRSPVDGYLAVYLLDESMTAYCLLPYSRDRTGIVKIEGGKDYIFFSSRHAERQYASIVDEYSLTCERDVEHDLMYILFSPNEFTKANDAPADEETLPRQLSFDDFQYWLTRSRLRDRDMKVEIRTITIRK